jgi:hypothetical protein
MRYVVVAASDACCHRLQFGRWDLAVGFTPPLFAVFFFGLRARVSSPFTFNLPG